MKRILLTILTVLLCFGGFAVEAESGTPLTWNVFWGEGVWSLDCMYAVEGDITNVVCALQGCLYDWNYIPEKNLLLVAVASATPLPTSGTFLRITASEGTKLTLTSVLQNGKTAPIGFTIRGTITSVGSGDVTVTLLLDNTPVEGITITVDNTTGEYSVTDIPAGTYTLRISKPKHVTREYTVTVGKP